MSETVTLPTGETVPVSTPPDVPGLKIVAWVDMPAWAAEAFRQWHIGGQHPLGPYVHDFKAWVRSLKAAPSYLERTSVFYRWGKTAEVKFGNEDFDVHEKEDEE